MNNDLISRKSLIEAMKKAEAHGLALGDEQSVMAAAAIAGMREYIVQMVPAVDAVEVVHERWNRKQIGKYTGIDEVVCSCCGYFLAVVGTDIGFKEAIKDMNYCPNCGAMMDGERIEER